jgi:hypothetical protein
MSLRWRTSTVKTFPWANTSKWKSLSLALWVPHDHLLLDSASDIGPPISRWELDKFKNCWNKSFRSSKILTLLYQQFSNLSISQRDMSGPRLGALSKNRWSGGTYKEGWFSNFVMKLCHFSLHTCVDISWTEFKAACGHAVVRYIL